MLATCDLILSEGIEPNMQLSELFEVAVSVLASVGSGGAIVLGLSSWLGKVWAERLMEKEKAHYQKELEDFKAQLSREGERTAQTLREKLSLYKEPGRPGFCDSSTTDGVRALPTCGQRDAWHVRYAPGLRGIQCTDRLHLRLPRSKAHVSLSGFPRVIFQVAL